MYFQYGQEETEYLSGKDEKLGAVIAQVGRVNREVDTDLFSAVVHHIVGQQISTKAQATIWQRMRGALGTVDAEHILEAGNEQLQLLGISCRKAEYITDFARKIQNGEFDLEGIWQKPDEEVIRELSALKGIGVWTAEMILLFCMDAGLLQYRKKANEIVARLMAKDNERTAVYREYEQGSILLEQVEEYEHQYQVAVQKQEAAFKKVMLAVNDIEKAFSHGNPWLMKFRAISIPEKLERTHLKEWLDHVWIVDFEQVEVILQESEWKRFFPEEWLNNGEEDCNGKKE